MEKNLSDRPTMRYDNRYIGQVVDVDDPQRHLRVKVKIFGVFTDNVEEGDLPWADIALPHGARYNEGFTTSMAVNDYVWVDFPFMGDTRRPRVLGSVLFAPNEEVNAPHEMWLGPDAIEHERIIAPEPAPRAYYENNVYSQGGIVVEMLPTGSIIVTQRESGAAIEITPDGDITLHTKEGNIYLETESGNIHAHTLFGDIIAHAVAGNVSVTAGAVISLVAGVAITMSAPTIIMASSSCTLELGANAQCQGDFGVDGNIEATGDIIDGGENTNHHEH